MLGSRDARRRCMLVAKILDSEWLFSAFGCRWEVRRRDAARHPGIPVSGISCPDRRARCADAGACRDARLCSAGSWGTADTCRPCNAQRGLSCSPGKPQLPEHTRSGIRFGEIKFRPANDPRNPDGIIITNGFASNIVSVAVPQLANLTGAPPNLTTRCHQAVVPQLLGLWSAWEKAGLLSRVKTFGGAFEPRFVRGHSGELSNHAFGAAFDINFPWNPLDEVPALVGKRGCVRELVPIANHFGFFWGGHFSNRLDGNHFEVARVMAPGSCGILASSDFV